MALRVLMTGDAGESGFRCTVELIGELSKRGVEVVLAIVGRPLARDQRATLAGVARFWLREHPSTLDWTTRPWRDNEDATAWLRELEQEFAPDIVHVNEGAQANGGFRAPLVVTAHGSALAWWKATFGLPPPSEYSAHAERITATLGLADLVIAATSTTLKSMRCDYEYRGEVRVIPHGLKATPFSSGIKQPFFLALAEFWDRANNFELLERAAPRLPWRLLAAGQSGDRKRTAFWLEGIELLGPLPKHEVLGLLSRAAVFLHPVRYDPIGLAPLEAALSGCALVLGDIPSLRECWSDCALFVAPDDSDALVAAANRLARDPELRAELAGSARERARQYSTTASADAHLHAYNDAIRARRGQRWPTLRSLTERSRHQIDTSVRLLSRPPRTERSAP
ncbi:MAG TPA: glycosyltransferase family 4 protein [Polyangiaceae bacterium]